MDEQTPIPSEDAATGQATPDPVTPNTPTTEPPQTEPTEAPSEAVITPEAQETPHTEPLSLPMPETGTAQMGRNEPLPELEPPADTPSVAVPTATPQQETPMPVEPQPIGANPTPPPPDLPAQANTLTTSPPSIIRLLLQKAQLTIQLRKQKKLTKIMGLFLKKTHITNDEVEKLLHVSDATATRYLSQLEKQGKIKQSGKTGKGVTYIKI